MIKNYQKNLLCVYLIINMNNNSEFFVKNQENEDKDRIYSSLFFSACFVSILWIIQIFQHVSEIDLSAFGIFPGKVTGLKGILFSPLIHSGYSHLISNSVTLFFTLFLYFSEKFLYK